MAYELLIIDDEESICFHLQEYFSLSGYKVKVAGDGKTALDLVRMHDFDVALIDLKLPDMSGLDVLRELKRSSPDLGALMITAHGTISTAVQAMQLGAENFILKPVDLVVLENLIQRILENKRTRFEAAFLSERISQLEHIPQRLRFPSEIQRKIQLLAQNPGTIVLILGDTGTGKGMLARAIHDQSSRSQARFVEINCASLTKEFLELELFGYDRGAFTDAKKTKRGLMEVADKGTLFLDELSELSLSVQARLLKVLETKTFHRLGGTNEIEVDTRIIVATNVDLEKLVQKGEFRKDLYFRLNTMPIRMPTLVERKDEILDLAHDFLREYNHQFSKDIKGLADEIGPILTSYHWPGNIRELRNVLERAVLLCDGPLIQAQHLPDSISKPPGPFHLSLDPDNLSLEQMESNHIKHVLELVRGNRSKASELLGITRNTLLNKIKKYDLS
ncbi:sigma-54-dependent Fis family transcriptional regulator [bacterium]|nr:sigma-54-dependent Fis family transcriptional regulator [bacterium]